MQIMPALLAVSQAGQTITKSTSVSIALVAMLMGATYFAGVTFATTDARLDNMEGDIKEIKEYILNNGQSAFLFDQSVIEDAIHNVLFEE